MVSPLHGLQSSPSGLFLRTSEEAVMSNALGAQVMFLWGNTAPNGIRCARVCFSSAERGKLLGGRQALGCDAVRLGPACFWAGEGSLGSLFLPLATLNDIDTRP